MGSSTVLNALQLVSQQHSVANISTRSRCNLHSHQKQVQFAQPHLTHSFPGLLAAYLCASLVMQKQPTKAQKRRQHQADRDAEREAELEAERAEQGESEQAVEDKQLREMLTPLSLTIRAIQVSCFIPRVLLAETPSFVKTWNSVAVRHRHIQHQRTQPSYWTLSN